MARGRVFPFRRPIKIALLWLHLVGWSLGLLLLGWQWIGDVRGATVDAEVVSVMTNVPGRRVYDVRLVTLSGRVCVAEVDSGSSPPPREIRIGGMARVHYSVNDTCADGSVRESTSESFLPFAIFASVAMVASLLGLRRLHRNR